MVSTASGAQQPQVESFGNLKKCAARILRAENQPKILEEAGVGILRGINDLNLRHVFRFGSKQTSDTALVSGTATVALPSGTFAVETVQLIDTDSKVHSLLRYVPWGTWNMVNPKQNDSGTPVEWTVRNSFDDEVLIINPVPDAGAASDFTSRVTYFERIAQPSVDSDIVDAPKELGELLCTYGEYYLLDIHGTRQEALSKKAEYHEKVGLMGRSTERSGNTFQFRLSETYDDPDSSFDPLG